MNSIEIVRVLRNLLVAKVPKLEATAVKRDEQYLATSTYVRFPKFGAYKIVVTSVSDAEMRQEFQAQLDARRIPEHQRPSWIRR